MVVLRDLLVLDVLETKAKVRKDLEARKAAGDVWTKEALVKSLKAAGVAPGKDLLVHSAMSSIGYVEGGPATVVAALLELVGTEAHLLMPSSPVVTLQAEHPQTAFDHKSRKPRMQLEALHAHPPILIS